MSKTTREIEIKDTASRSSELEGYQQTTDDLVGEKLVLNMGPSHPATHGVLRLVLEMDGEVITKADPDIGFLHRGEALGCRLDVVRAASRAEDVVAGVDVLGDPRRQRALEQARV